MKLADFGLARSLSTIYSEPTSDMSELPELTEYVATRWYRAPEILLSAKRYTKGVDLWSLGCILGEMMLGHALFPGTSTMNQIERIMRVIPAPSKTDIDKAGSVYAESVLSKIPMLPGGALIEILSKNSPELAVDLVAKLLVFNPNKRLNIEQALRHAYVAAFRNPASELVLIKDVTLAFPDDVQLDISEYRNKLYEMMPYNRNNQLRNMHIELQKAAAQASSAVAQPAPNPPAGVPNPGGSGKRSSKHSDDITPKSRSSHSRGSNRQHAQYPGTESNSSHSPQKPAAPLAQAEASDTDLDTTRSRQNGHSDRHNHHHQHNNNNIGPHGIPRSSSDIKQQMGSASSSSKGHNNRRSNSSKRRSSFDMANGHHEVMHDVIITAGQGQQGYGNGQPQATANVYAVESHGGHHHHNKRSWSLHKERREHKDSSGAHSSGSKVRFLRRYAKAKENYFD